MARTLWSFILLSRPHFLFGAALFYALGASAATWAGATIDWDRYWLGQAMVTCIQLMTHYTNEYFDQVSDQETSNRTWLTGGSGVLVDGRLSSLVAIRAAAAMATVGGALVVWAYLVEPLAGLLGLVALLTGWFYSAPPLRLEGTGLGEVAATAVVAVLVPLTAVAMQGVGVPKALWWTVGGLALLQFAMMLAFSLPDVQADQRSGKLVLAARLGPALSRMLQSLALLGGFLVITTGMRAGVIPGSLLLMIPAVVAAVVQVNAAGREQFSMLVTSAAATLLLAAGASTANFLI